MFNLTPIVKNLLIINVVMFLIPQLILSNSAAFIQIFGLRYILSPEFSPYQFLTYALIHSNSGWGHLFSNMLGLIVFGPILEYTLGARRFLFFYVACALGAGIIYSGIHFFEVYPVVQAGQQFLLDPNPEGFIDFLSKMGENSVQTYLQFVDEYSRNPQNAFYTKEAEALVSNMINQRMNIPMVGASGAIFGIMMGFGYLYPNLQMMLLFPPIPVKAKYVVGFYGILALYSSIERVPGDNVAHFAHLGGMVVGYLLIRYWKTTSIYR